MMYNNHPPMQAQQERNYTPAAWLCALLSFFLVIPGLIATIIYLFEADSNRRRTGVTPQGYGCLWAVFVWCVLPLVGVVVLMWVIALSAWARP